MPEAVKQRRLREVIETFNAGARAANEEEVGRRHLVMLEGVSKKSADEWMGRTDTNKRVVVRRAAVGAADAADAASREMRAGDFVAVRVTEAISANRPRRAARALHHHALRTAAARRLPRRARASGRAAAHARPGGRDCEVEVETTRGAGGLVGTTRGAAPGAGAVAQNFIDHIPPNNTGISRFRRVARRKQHEVSQ